jgi:hypothetical protein
LRRRRRLLDDELNAEVAARAHDSIVGLFFFGNDGRLSLSEAKQAAVAVKETKAQKVERLKREKNPWEAWDEVRQFAREGRGSVLPEWTGTYFKWWGIYTQGDGLGVTGGVGGEGKASEYRAHNSEVRARGCRYYNAPEYSVALADD